MNRERETASGLPSTSKLYRYMRQVVTIGSSGGLFLSPENLITQTYKGNNKYTKLDKIRICNIHWHRPPFYRSEGWSLRKDQRVSRPALVSLPIYYHSTVR